MSTARAARRFVPILLALAVVSCTLAPGADPIVVNAERVLKAAPAIYDAAMTFGEQNKANFSPATLQAFEKVRVNFPGAYRSLDSAVQVYAAATSKDPTEVVKFGNELKRLLAEAAALVRINGGPDLGLKE